MVIKIDYLVFGIVDGEYDLIMEVVIMFVMVIVFFIFVDDEVGFD